MTVRLRLLGGVGLADSDGQDVRAVLAQPKRLALLVYLAAANPSGFHRRDTLLVLFWPDADEVSARAALSRALHHLRQALGAEVIVSRGDQELAVDRSRLTSDLFELEDALESGDVAAALALYRGDLLPGFHVDGATEFDTWLEGERQRIRTLVGKGASAASFLAERAGDQDAAVSFARRASELAPYSESDVLHLMGLLDAQGNRSDALLTYEAFVARFRADLEASPGNALQAAAEQIRRGLSGPAEGGDRPTAPIREEVVAPPGRTRMLGERRQGSAWRRAAPWALVVVILSVIGWLLAGRGSAALPPTVRFTVTIPAQIPPMDMGAAIALSPDGQDLVYVGRVRGRSQLFLRTLDQTTARALAGTEDAQGPFFSPDGRSIGYWARGHVWRIPVTGGESVTLTDVWWVAGVAWLTEDQIVLGRTPGNERLKLLGVAGGKLQDLPLSRRGDVPVALPGGKGVLFGGEKGIISMAGLHDSAAASLGVFGRPVGLLDHWMIYIRPGGALMALPVDLERRQATGAPVQQLNGTLVLSAALAPNGTLVYIRRSSESRAMLVTLSGEATPLFEEQRDLAFPAVSPDGQQVAFMTPSSIGHSISIYDIPSKTFRRLTTVGSERPAWTGDGRRVGFTGKGGAFWVSADGSGRVDTIADLISDHDAGLREVTFSPDNRYAVLRNDGRDTKRDLWLLPLGSGVPRVKPVPLEMTPFNELMPRVSPDSRHLVFVSDASGSYEVYLRPFPGPGPTIQVSTDGGTEPVWGPDGRGIFYRANGKVMLAALSPSAPLRVLRRTALFEDKYLSYEVHQQYDVMPDGRRLLMLEPIQPGDQEGQVVFVVVGWLRELRQQFAAATRGGSR